LEKLGVEIKHSRKSGPGKTESETRIKNIQTNVRQSQSESREEKAERGNWWTMKNGATQPSKTGTQLSVWSDGRKEKQSRSRPRSLGKGLGVARQRGHAWSEEKAVGTEKCAKKV